MGKSENVDASLRDIILSSQQEYQRWSQLREYNERHHGRPFYDYDEDPYYSALRGPHTILDKLPTFCGQNIDEWITVLLKKNKPLRGLDIGSGIGRALRDIAEHHNYPSTLSLYGYTAGRYFKPSEDENIKERVPEPMHWPDDQLIFGDIAYIDKTIKTQSSYRDIPSQFDFIYSYGSLAYAERPPFHLLRKIYKIVSHDGMAFLGIGFNRHIFPVQNKQLVEEYLQMNGYEFEMQWSENDRSQGWYILEKCAFKKTHDELILPIRYDQRGWGKLE